MSNPLWTRRRVLGLGAAVTVGTALAGCSLSPGSTQDDDIADPDAGWAGAQLDPPFAKPDFTFQTVDGKPFPFREKTAGKLTILFYGYTSCPDVCPVTLNTLARAIEGIGTGPGSQPLVTFVGVDLARDTPANMKKYLGNIDPSFVGLLPTGDTVKAQEAELVQSLAALHEAPPIIGTPDANGDYEVGHPAAVYVFSPDNKAHRRFPGAQVRQREWARDLPRLDQAPYT